MLKGKFDMKDFLDQIGMLKKMGPLQGHGRQDPGHRRCAPEGAQISDDELVRIESMISSMTEDERRHPERFIVTSWEEVVEGGKRKKKRSAFYETRASGARRARLRPAGAGGGRPAQSLRDDAADDDADRMSTGLLGKIPGFKQLAQAKKMMGLDVNQLANMMQTPSAERGHFQAPKRNVDRAEGKAQAQGRPQGAQEGTQAPLAARGRVAAVEIAAQSPPRTRTITAATIAGQHRRGDERRAARAMHRPNAIARPRSVAAPAPTASAAAMAGCSSLSVGATTGRANRDFGISPVASAAIGTRCGWEAAAIGGTGPVNTGNARGRGHGAGGRATRPLSCCASMSRM
jgi:hypothetical protein